MTRAARRIAPIWRRKYRFTGDSPHKADRFFVFLNTNSSSNVTHTYSGMSEERSRHTIWTGEGQFLKAMQETEYSLMTRCPKRERTHHIMKDTLEEDGS